MSNNRFIEKLLSPLLIAAIFMTLNCLSDKKSAVPKALKTTVEKDTLVSQLESNIPKIMEKAMIPGLSIAVIRDGELLWTKGFGVKNSETNEPVTDETVYEAASFSKPVYSYAVLKLVERGELELDKPLIEYVTDEYLEENYLGRKIDDERFRKITTRMVLTHSPGFPNWRGRDSLKINFEPGEKFSYSGEGFGYLQKVVEKISGLSLNDFMKKELFDPLDMTSSSYVWQESYDEYTSCPHDMMGEIGRKGKPRGGGHAAASLHTTATDFARYMMAIMNHTGLQQSTVDSMLTPQIVVDPEETQDVVWGLGIGLEKTPHGIAYWHWGDNMTFRCFFIAFPQQKIGVVYFTNSFFGLAVRKQIVDLAIGGEHPVQNSNLLSNYGDVDSPGMEFTRTLVKSGVDAAIEKYYQMRDTLSAKEIMEEYAMNGIGYSFMRKKQYRDAIKIFKLNVEAYPDAFNVYDSLGEAYMENGDTELAIKNYEKSLELNPDNENGKKMLEKLKKK
ncbi:MAG: class A beta-lactamase-related serine hydrolase [bacterium]|nr:MAG: class A beta-lactamase-related serine hydrolase [bacterium]